MLCTSAINTSNTTRTQTGAAERYMSQINLQRGTTTVENRKTTK